MRSGGEPDIRAGLLGHLRPRRQRARHQLVVAVEPRGDAVHVADEGSRAAADHAQPNPPRAGFRHRRLLSIQPEDLAVGRLVGARRREVVEGLLGDVDDVRLR